MKKIELLSPAKNLEVGIAAINHGADAVYIGGPSFGAREKVGNSIEDIEALCKHAALFDAKVYVTMNTLLYDSELEDARKLAYDCWNAGVDALIVQDMALLNMDMPPIALHASTQCHNIEAEKVKFLEDVGFSQVVLARELSIEQIYLLKCCLKQSVRPAFTEAIGACMDWIRTPMKVKKRRQDCLESCSEKK